MLAGLFGFRFTGVPCSTCGGNATESLRMSTNQHKTRPWWELSAVIHHVRRRMRHGQAMVEFALIAPLAVALMVVGIQFAMIGQADLAVGQLAYFGARYASVNYAVDGSAVQSQMLAQGSPTITRDSSKLTITMTCSPGPCTPPRSFGTQVTVNISYDASAQLVLPNPFLGITFPTTMTAQDTAMTE